MRWPAKIPAGTTCSEPAMTIDVLPTLAKITGAELPDHAIDGKNILPLIAGEAGAKGPQEAYYFYWGNKLHAVRKDKWSLHLPHSYRSLKGEPGRGGIPGPYVQKTTALALFDLHADIGQTKDVSADHPEVVKELQALADAHVRYLSANSRKPAQH